MVEVYWTNKKPIHKKKNEFAEYIHYTLKKSMHSKEKLWVSSVTTLIKLNNEYQVVNINWSILIGETTVTGEKTHRKKAYRP